MTENLYKRLLFSISRYAVESLIKYSDIKNIRNVT